MTFRYLAACAMATALASGGASAAQYQLAGGYITSSVPTSFFDSVTTEWSPLGNFFQVFLTKNIGGTPVESFSITFEKLFSYATFEVSESVNVPPYSIMFSAPKLTLNYSAQGAALYYIAENNVRGNFITTAPGPTAVTLSSTALTGGKGLAPSDDPTCGDFSCMTPYQATGTMRILLAYQLAAPPVPEPESAALALAAAGVIASIARRRANRSGKQPAGLA